MSAPVRLIIATFLSGIVCWLSATHRPWDFIQRVGGIEIRQPVYQGQRLVLPVNCNVSGLKRITCPPTQLNSGLVIRSVSAESSGSDIWISVVTCLPDSGRAAGGIHYADLSGLRPGSYHVYYGDPPDRAHPVGAVVVSD